MPWGERDEVQTFGRPLAKFTVRVCHERRALSDGAQAVDGQQDLVLPAAPGAGGVDVECEHSSHSLANFSAT